MHVKVDRDIEFVKLIAFVVITCAAVTDFDKILEIIQKGYAPSWPRSTS